MSIADGIMLETLGIPSETPGPTSALGMLRLIEEGLPVESLDRVAKAVRPQNPRALRDRLYPRGTSGRGRMRGIGGLPPATGERVIRTARVWGRAVEVWKSPEAARAFLDRPHPLLEGRTPLDLVVGTDMGARLVEAILGRLQHGSAA